MRHELPIAAALRLMTPDGKTRRLQLWSVASETPCERAKSAVTIGDGTTQPKLIVTITDLGGGQFSFSIVQDCRAGYLVGDLRAFYIDWQDTGSSAFNPTTAPTVSNLSYKGAAGSFTGQNAVSQVDIGGKSKSDDVTRQWPERHQHERGARHRPNTRWRF